MELHWKDKYDDLENWSHLEFSVQNSPAPNLKLQSGNNQKFKLLKNEETVFWGRVDPEWYGVHFLRNNNNWDKEDMIIPPISSADVEKIGSSSNLRAWSRFFVEKLKNSSYSPLQDGKWRLNKCGFDNAFISNRHYHIWLVQDIHEAFSANKPEYIDWGISGSDRIIALKEEPDNDSGRVKWFKKLATQKKCPPILVWYLNCLDAYIILDGHCRLKANIETDTHPEILVLNSFFEIPVEQNERRQQAILNQLESRQKDPTKKKIPVDHINKLLLEAFDDRPLNRVFTKSKASDDLENIWNEEVRSFINKKGVDHEELSAMLE